MSVCTTFSSPRGSGEGKKPTAGLCKPHSPSKDCSLHPRQVLHIRYNSPSDTRAAVYEGMAAHDHTNPFCVRASATEPTNSSALPGQAYNSGIELRGFFTAKRTTQHWQGRSGARPPNNGRSLGRGRAASSKVYHDFATRSRGAELLARPGVQMALFSSCVIVQWSSLHQTNSAKEERRSA